MALMAWAIFFYGQEGLAETKDSSHPPLEGSLATQKGSFRRISLEKIRSGELAMLHGDPTLERLLVTWPYETVEWTVFQRKWNLLLAFFKKCQKIKYFWVKVDPEGFAVQGVEGVQKWVEALDSCPTLEGVCISFRNVGEAGSIMLAEALGRLPRLKELSIVYDQLEEKGATALARVLQNATLRVLKLTVSEEKEGKARKILLSALTSCRGLESLSLTGLVKDRREEALLALGVKRIPQLRKLVLRHAKITSPDIFEALSPFPLQVLEVSGLSSKGAASLANVLKNFTHLRILGLPFHMMNLEEKDWKNLAAEFIHCSMLEELNLFGNSLEEEGSKALASSLLGLSSLQKFNLGKNELEDSLLDRVILALSHCPRLKVLNFSITGVGKGEAFADLLKRCAALEELHLLNANLGKKKMEKIAKGLRHCLALKVLALGRNELGNEEAKVLESGIRGLSALHTLSLFRNNIGDEGIKALADVLKSCPHLTECTFFKNKIGKDGVKALAEAWKHCGKLKRLDLSHNLMGNRGVEALSAMIPYCPKLVYLSLSNNGIGDKGVIVLAGALRFCSHLQHLSLSGNVIRNGGTEILAYHMRGLSWLNFLDLSRNELGDKGANALKSSLCSIPDLRIDLQGNGISDSVKGELVREFQDRVDLQEEVHSF